MRERICVAQCLTFPSLRLNRPLLASARLDTSLSCLCLSTSIIFTSATHHYIMHTTTFTVYDPLNG